jgi:taurine dioxygenase
MRPRAPVLGAEIIGLDLEEPLPQALFQAIEEALHRYQVLVFREQTLSVEAQVRFSRSFGELQVHVLNQYHSPNPEVLLVTNLDETGKPSGSPPDPGAQIWHTDGSWSSRPGKVTLLYGLEIPVLGGDTAFANMYAAYEALSAADQQHLAGLRAVHDLHYSRSRTRAKDQMTAAQRAAAPPVEHAIVKTHPQTGRKCLYLGEHASHIAGMPLAEGRALIAQLNAHATQPAFVYQHRWQVRDVLLWDNRCVLHRAGEYDYGGERRIIRRTTVLVERDS